MVLLTERVKAVYHFRYQLIMMLLLGSVCAPANAYALGFGTLSLHSHLNEGLKADVPIILNASDDIRKVQVALASRQEYRQLGLQWNHALSGVRVLMQGKHSAAPFIELRSTGVIQAPLLSIVLKANKVGYGVHFRHFQLFLDPLEMLPMQTAQPIVLPLQSSLKETVTIPIASEQGWARTWRYGPVRAGDSLSEIAYRLRRDKRYSNRQVMLSLFEKNPDSFVNADINHLKKSTWLSVPSGEVVKTYASESAMKKLSGLLNRSRPVSQPVSQPVSPPVTQPAAAAKAVKVAPVQSPQELRYSGKISLHGATGNNQADQGESAGKGIGQQFDAIHAQMMSGKLQMTNLGKSVSSLNQSVQIIKQDIHDLKKDVAFIKVRAGQSQGGTFSPWQIILFALFAAVVGAVLATAFRKRVLPDSPAPTVARVNANTKETIEEDPFAGEEAEAAPLADDVVQLLNQTEESLSQCEFEKAEQMLGQIDAMLPDSLRAMVLKAQLLHETDRHAERNALINSVSESADKERWEHFCQLLPSHVWNACFGDGMGTHDQTGNR